MNPRKKGLWLQSILAANLIVLSACSDNDSPGPQPQPDPEPQPQSKTFTVEIVNLTANQPLSPVGLISHSQGAVWQTNQAASLALETLAESGDNSQLLSLPLVDVGVSGEAPVGPGESQILTLQTELSETVLLSMATMLVNTNDAFTGFSQLDVTNLSVGDSLKRALIAYDAGTEGNSELAGTIPGPADGGEGFNAQRDDVDFVANHRGVVSLNDGLSASILAESHRFDNPVVRVSITRTE